MDLPEITAKVVDLRGACAVVVPADMVVADGVWSLASHLVQLAADGVIPRPPLIVAGDLDVLDEQQMRVAGWVRVEQGAGHAIEIRNSAGELVYGFEPSPPDEDGDPTGVPAVVHPAPPSLSGAAALHLPSVSS